MSAILSSSKASAILTEVQKNPEIGTNDATYVQRLIQQAAEDLVAYTHLPRYPELTKGYAVSGSSASTDISGLATNDIDISVNGSAWVTIELTLSGLTTGAAIKTELQSKIQAESEDGFDEVTVTYDNSDDTYTITSGRFGEASAINFDFAEETKHVAQNLKLSPQYGSREFTGSWARDGADDALVEMTEVLYRKLGLEGVKSGNVPGDGGFAMYENELSPGALRKLQSMRRFWT